MKTTLRDYFRQRGLSIGIKPEGIEIRSRKGRVIAEGRPRWTEHGLVIHERIPEGEPVLARGQAVELRFGDLDAELPAGARGVVLYPCDHWENPGWHYRTRFVFEGGEEYIDLTLAVEQLRVVQSQLA